MEARACCCLRGVASMTWKLATRVFDVKARIAAKLRGLLTQLGE